MEPSTEAPYKEIPLQPKLYFLGFYGNVQGIPICTELLRIIHVHISFVCAYIQVCVYIYMYYICICIYIHVCVHLIIDTCAYF